MSKHTQPPRGGLHSHSTASIGCRLNATTGPGSEYAKLVWIVVLSHAPWGTLRRATWATNETLRHECGIPVSEVERGLSRLRDANMLETPWGVRPGAARKFGRLLKPALGAPCKVLIPDRHDMANLWALCRERRKRPISLVTMTVGAYALGCDHAGHRPWEWTPIGCRQADWRRFVGARKNASWTARVRELEALDIIRRQGRAVEVAPTRSWLRAQRAINEVDPCGVVSLRGVGPPLAA